MSAAITICRLSKRFAARRKRLTLAAWLHQSVRPRGAPQFFYALQGLDLSVERGDRIGLIGGNGAGKTTLLKLIAGLYAPDEGALDVSGSRVLLAGLGIGMLDDLSVEDNVMLCGAIYGVEPASLRASMSRLLEWAELQEFAGAQLKRLSTGMRTRLAFAIVPHIPADIFLLDEALSAGDRAFSIKCQRVFEEYKKSEKTFVVASHDLEFMKIFCNKVLWLEKGRPRSFGEAARVLGEYHSSISRPPGA